jgi:hypothetical protein
VEGVVGKAVESRWEKGVEKSGWKAGWERREEKGGKGSDR